MKIVNVSIVIPVYNEAANLRACLDALAAQTVAPYEVIVVDNNSTDNSADIAREYAGVTVATEKRQGVVYARDTGFDLAEGDVIGRIDADTVLATDWVATVQEIFNDVRIDAASGRAKYHDMALSSVLNFIDLHIRHYLARMLNDEYAMQGANMALRRSVWERVRNEVCRTGGMHEDLDLSVHIRDQGYNVVFDPSMVATLGFRQAGTSYAKFCTYIMLSPKTYARHGLTSQRHMYPVCALAIACYLPLRILHRGYDKRQGKFSILQLLTAPEARVNPATFVD